MGFGKYRGDADKRPTAVEFRETATAYSSGGIKQAEPVGDPRQNSVPVPMPMSDFVSASGQANLIDPTISHFSNFGIDVAKLEEASQIAQLTGRAAGEELIRSGAVTRTDFAQFTASHLGVEFSPNGPRPEYLTPASLRLGGMQTEPQLVEPQGDFSEISIEFNQRHEQYGIYLVCDPAARDAIENIIARAAIDQSPVTLTTRKGLHNSQFIAKQSMHLNNAIHGLSKNFPDKSALRIITPWQVFAIFVMVAGTVLSFWLLPSVSMLGLHIFASIFYISVTIMRGFMIVSGENIINNSLVSASVSKSKASDRELPIYTLLVALYKEAGQVDELVGALGKIDWPEDRLQILLICEADDPDTIAKCYRYSADERFQTVVCPVSLPRTKPKALNFALPLAKGEFLVLYDAEDRPHPLQLREAHDKFLTDGDLGCLQAPLFVHNDRQSWFSRMFAIEYTTLFGLMLPVLERWRAPIPLGGTSNHFRTKVLREIGAWDPYNVTEDADLGIRMARTGYHCGTISLPTMEEAPPVFGVWFKQRTRWIKGWIQTLLVHLRNPVTLMRELGLRRSIYFHLIITSIVVSALIHPFFIVSSIYYGVKLARGMSMDNMTLYILGIDAFNLVGAYSTYFAVAILALGANKKRYLARSIIWIPFYWILISLAGWRAVGHLFYAPFVWEKTQHGLAKTDESGALFNED